MTAFTAPKLPSFDPLKFRMDDQGQAHFDDTVFQRHRSVLSDILADPIDAQLIDLIIVWYLLHRAQGGAANIHLETLLQEVECEQYCGQAFSLTAGHG